MRGVFIRHKFTHTLQSRDESDGTELVCDSIQEGFLPGTKPVQQEKGGCTLCNRLRGRGINGGRKCGFAVG